MSESSGSLFARLKSGLARTRGRLAGGIGGLLFGRARVDAEVIADLEALLLSADAGMAATQVLLAQARKDLSRQEAVSGGAVQQRLRDAMVALLQPCERPLDLGNGDPSVILLVGVNGAGKTTTAGKLAAYLQRNGRSVLLAAGDTFRAAAIEQLRIWGDRISVPVIAQQPGSDSAAVIFDALQAARSRRIDTLIADTSGRLHTKSGLMDELAKVKRVIGRFDARAPQEILLVLDAGNGQNALVQAQQFHAALGVTGIVLTKLDGTAKGGIVFAIARQLGLPIKFIGIGEEIEDLRPFEAEPFVDALLSG